MAPHADADFIALQSALAGEYSLDRELGRGGMGIVYLAREVRLGRPVAIKVLPPTLEVRDDLREAFLREAQVAARLNHPNIVPVYAAGERNGFVYIVMAYVDGLTLGERIRTRGPLLPGQAARVLREVAWALAYAHGARIVHRDISAENVLLERGTERAIVMDFGIASAMQTAAVDASGRVMGNPHYMSPEQAAGEPLDARSDLYSLGIVGYYALTGRLPFDGETSADVITQHLTAIPPSIVSVMSSAPPRLAAAVERCLHKEPLRRYRSAESFAEAIDLAFEHAKEIPAPLRSWINQGDRELSARLAMVGMGTMVGISAALAFRAPWLFLIPFGSLGGLSFIPWLTRLRGVLRDGFTSDDLHAALREHQLVRSEEIEYERRQGSPLTRRVLRVLFGASLGGASIGAYVAYDFMRHFAATGRMTQLEFAQEQQVEMQVFALLLASLIGLTISGVPLAGEFIRLKLASRFTVASISFWKGKWGRRLAKIAGVGISPADRPQLGMPVLTEIALGRATDHLFDALPKATRKQLASLPPTVRKLEDSAARLRESIAAFDDQLSAFDRTSDGHDASRASLADEVASARALAAERLSSTVAALEGIRLDLLRLQMGSAGIESVTASIDAAERVGAQIGFHVSAQDAVEALLAPREELSQPGDSADDDTPVGGVAAAHA